MRNQNIERYQYLSEKLKDISTRELSISKYEKELEKLKKNRKDMYADIISNLYCGLALYDLPRIIKYGKLGMQYLEDFYNPRNFFYIPAEVADFIIKKEKKYLTFQKEEIIKQLYFLVGELDI